MFGSEMNKAQRPVYGDAQKGQFMSELNDMASDTVRQLQGDLAASGALQSGRFATGMENIGREKVKRTSQFMSQLPFQEEGARSQRTNALMEMATKWLGMGPVDETITGNQVGQSTMTGTETSKSNTTQTQQGAPWWKSLLGAGASFGGGILGDVVSGQGGRWGFGGGGKNTGGNL